MRHVGNKGRSAIEGWFVGKGTAERYAAEERLLEHPQRRAGRIALVWGTIQWTIAWHHDTRLWMICYTIATATSTGYLVVHLIRRRHRRSQYWSTGP